MFTKVLRSVPDTRVPRRCFSKRCRLLKRLIIVPPTVRIWTIAAQVEIENISSGCSTASYSFSYAPSRNRLLLPRFAHPKSQHNGLARQVSRQAHVSAAIARYLLRPPASTSMARSKPRSLCYSGVWNIVLKRCNYVKTGAKTRGGEPAASPSVPAIGPVKAL